MKKLNFLKIVLSAAFAVFLANGAFAQENAPDANMTATQANEDSVTANSKMLYYVEPDPVLNSISSQYDTTADRASNNVNSTFSFDWAATPGHTIFTPTEDADAPFRVIRFDGGTGQSTLQATETASVGTGCSDPTPTELTINVIAEPTFTVGGGSVTEICESDGGITNISIGSYNVATDGSYLELLVDVTVETDDGSGSWTEVRNESDSTIVIWDPTTSTPSEVVMPDYWLGANGGNITRYTFDFGSGTSTDAGTSNGINDYISRKSDYFDGAGDDIYYEATDADADRVLTWIVYPAPETGDIYYIPNSFDN